MKVIVFDLGGTLMQYTGMPHSWIDFYYAGFEAIIQKFKCHIPKDTVEKSYQILKEFNPRINYREIEYSAEYIFTKILEPWHIDIPIQHCMEIFWSGLQLKAEIYPETRNVLQKLREKGYAIAALTDLPSAMPDEIFRRDISELIFVGDEEKDRKTAYNAHCRFIRIQRKEKAEESINNLYGLLEILE